MEEVQEEEGEDDEDVVTLTPSHPSASIFQVSSTLATLQQQQRAEEQHRGEMKRKKKWSLEQKEGDGRDTKEACDKAEDFCFVVSSCSPSVSVFVVCFL